MKTSFQRNREGGGGEDGQAHKQGAQPADP